MLGAIIACQIVISGGTNGNWQEKYEHELAHCNGWVHEHGVHGLKPPKKYVHKPSMRTIVYEVPLQEAKRLCDGAMACQVFIR